MTETKAPGSPGTLRRTIKGEQYEYTETDGGWDVVSVADPKVSTYKVSLCSSTGVVLGCSCPSYHHRGGVCKHMADARRIRNERNRYAALECVALAGQTAAEWARADAVLEPVLACLRGLYADVRDARRVADVVTLLRLADERLREYATLRYQIGAALNCVVW